MKLFLVIRFFLINTVVQKSNCWKPITHPASFSVVQSFPDQGSDGTSRSSVIHSGPANSLLHSFNKNEFTDVSY